MSAATANNAPNGTSHGSSSASQDSICSPTFVKRVASIPVVADALGAVHSTIQGNAYSAAVYEKAEGAAIYLYEQSKPLQEKLAGPIGQVDAVANKGLDFVQAKAPYVFEVRTEELISKARQPADQAYAYGKTYTDAASARLAPITEQFQGQLTKSQQTINALQEKLQSAVQNIPKDSKAVQEQLKTLSEQVVAEIEKVSNYVGEKRKELPHQAQQAVGPLVEKLQKAFTDIRSELTKADTPLAQRASNVLQYSRDHANPIVHEVIDVIKKVVGKAEKKAGEVQNDENSAPRVNGH
ncbi:hypothetical protein CROQUDRAFT_670785 [Cronartium quercuum f. sp. fusiforme G11]|uniref:Uncharacterized protein n=1 Tax=Cronartium quercuum f. sp. fusiforme G11 TaxID=708437 RepID=A0A9P6TCS8_9BASI|nr:hypothetical protein CROQUDRAFT_670785 [Cronartium quercuum f. sp. fusiforme G11]